MARTLGDHELALPDGRRIGYTLYGDERGMPVVNCHGGLVSGHDVSPADEDARALGLCVISPDRPGVGRTDRLPGHGPLPWVDADLVPLLEHLEVEEFRVMGWSEGGLYALAVTHALAGRVVRCAVVAGCLPLDDRRTRKELNRLDRTLIGLSRHAPVAARAYFALTRVLSRHAPNLLLRQAVRHLPAEEATAVTERGRWLPILLGEGATDGRGGVDEYLALSAPWGFAPEDIAVPVHVFQGEADALVPDAWGRELARRIPGATITCYPGEGHFIALTRRRDVLESLV
ncbi:MAG TPA: alpha/beta hydrolase [Acidimicrobiales bacterium]|nr:alpha/beta hydrolase [Acidimicrobiales bacterium]